MKPTQQDTSEVVLHPWWGTGLAMSRLVWDFLLRLLGRHPVREVESSGSIFGGGLSQEFVPRQRFSAASSLLQSVQGAVEALRQKGSCITAWRVCVSVLTVPDRARCDALTWSVCAQSDGSQHGVRVVAEFPRGRHIARLGLLWGAVGSAWQERRWRETTRVLTRRRSFEFGVRTIPFEFGFQPCARNYRLRHAP